MLWLAFNGDSDEFDIGGNNRMFEYKICINVSQLVYEVLAHVTAVESQKLAKLKGDNNFLQDIMYY